jgi:hypothetical protein
MDSTIVRLNVGGKLFHTTKETLLGVDSAKQNFFHGLLNGSIGQTRDDSGALFVDRDPKLFEYILNALRHGGVLAADMSPLLVVAVSKEAQFYGVDLVTAHVDVDDSTVIANDAVMLLHVFGGATTSNFVKAVQVAVYGPLSPHCKRQIDALLDMYEHRTNNAFGTCA